MLNCLEIKKIQDGTIDISYDLLLTNSIRLVLVPMSYEIKGIAHPCGAWYQVEINSTIPFEQQRAALLHELTHIAKNDFDRLDPVEIIEEENEY